MKTVFAMSALALLMTVKANSQTTEMLVKSDVKTLKQEESQIKGDVKADKKLEKVIKKEMREDKKALRKLEGNQVSYQSKQAFYTDFGNIPGTAWTRSTYFDEATFTGKHSKRVTAYYDSDAQLVGTTTHKSFSDLPANVQKYINEKYSGYSKGDIIFFHDNQANESDMVLYGDPFDDADNYFVPLSKDGQTIILQASMKGDVSFFKKL